MNVERDQENIKYRIFNILGGITYLGLSPFGGFVKDFFIKILFVLFKESQLYQSICLL